MKTCWLETTDPGPYDFGPADIDWNQVLQGDRFAALVQIRALTYGPEFEFSVQCRQPACGSRIDWEFDLNELPVQPLSDENRESFINGNRFETALPDAGVKVWFQLLRGADERRLSKIRRANQDAVLSAILSHRIIEIDGVADRDKRKFVSDLSMADADFLFDEFDRVDCGLDTTIEIECPQCLAQQEIDRPFGRTFLMPGKGRTSRRRARSSSFQR